MAWCTHIRLASRPPLLLLVGGLVATLAAVIALAPAAPLVAAHPARPTADATATQFTLRARPVLRVREELMVSPVQGATTQAAGEGSDVPVAGGHLRARVRLEVAVTLVPTP